MRPKSEKGKWGAIAAACFVLALVATFAYGARPAAAAAGQERHQQREVAGARLLSLASQTDPTVVVKPTENATPIPLVLNLQPATSTPVPAPGSAAQAGAGGFPWWVLVLVVLAIVLLVPLLMRRSRTTVNR
jgi:hypothetical protein